MDALHSCFELGESIKSVSEEIGYTRASIYAWRKKYFRGGTAALKNDKNIPPDTLLPILDCFDGMVSCWTIGTSPDASLVNDMLDQAISCLKEDEHPLLHSDRGCHYRWSGWISRMKQAGLERSMSNKGCSPDNSACEGLFDRFKKEMFYNRDWTGVSIQEFINVLNAYLVWYNEKRIKISLGNMRSMEY